MNKSNIEDQIIRLIMGDLTAEENAEIRALMEVDPEVYQQYKSYRDLVRSIQNTKFHQTPDHTVARFNSWLQSQTTGQEVLPVRKIFWWKYAAAASIILLVGLAGVSQWIENRSAIRQFEHQKEFMIRLVSTEHTTSRIKGINQSYNMKTMDADVRDVLLRVLKTDPSTNVRLAALDALSQSLDDEVVKSTLIRVLESDTEPIVQISIINALVKIKDSSVKGTLRELLERDQVPDDVKEEAFLGITRL
jgi:hypothetical protein